MYILLYTVPLLFFLITGYITVSETATSNEYVLRKEDFHHPSDGDIGRLHRQRYPQYDEVIDMPCDRRTLIDPLVHQDYPNRISPGIGNQQVSNDQLKPVPARRNQEAILAFRPTESVAPRVQSKPVQKIPDETPIYSVGKVPEPENNFQMPLMQNNQQVDGEGISTKPGIPTKIKQQHPQFETSENKNSPQLNSEEVYMLQHNNEVPSHEVHHDTISYAAVKNRSIVPNKSNHHHDFTSPNINRDAEPSEDILPHYKSLKPEPNDNNADSSKNCNLQPEDLSQEGRRSMPKESTYEANRSPGLQSPSTKPLRKSHASASATIDLPSVLAKLSNQLSDPTKGAGITPLSEIRGGLLMESSRVCFACSTLNDASCSIPDRTTTIKYCRPGQEVCVTKSYRKTAGANLVVIRDCDTSCDSDTSGLNTRFESCAVCKEDLCNNLIIENSAFSINPINSIFILLCTAFVKYVV